MHRSRPVAAVAFLLFVCTPVFSQFGIIKTKVRLLVRQAPELYIPGRQVRLEVRSDIPAGFNPAAQIRAQLEQELPRANFDLLSQKPETVLRLVVTQFDPRISRDLRQESRYVHTGEHTAYNKKGEPYKVEDCAWQNVQVTHVVARGALGASLTLLDVATGAQLESQGLPIEYTRDAAMAGPQLCSGAVYDSLSATEADAVSLGNYLVQMLRASLQRKLFGWVESIEVLLATPSELKPGNALAVASQWAPALDRWSNASIGKQKTEAYRQYNLGVAYEALSYASADVGDATAYLQKAEAAYNKAMELHSEEKYFRPAFVRVNTGRLALQRRQEQVAQRQTEAEKRLAELREKTAPAIPAIRSPMPEEDTPEMKKFRDFARLRISRLNHDLSEAERERFLQDGAVFGLDRGVAERVVKGEEERARAARASLDRYREFFKECSDDTVISKEEREQLENFRQALNLSVEQAAEVEKSFLPGPGRPAAAKKAMVKKP